MMKSVRTGGVAALIAAATFVVGFVLALTVLAPVMSSDANALESVVFLADHQAIMYVWNLIIYVVFGIALVIATLALQWRLKANSPDLAQTATAFGLIWAGLVIASGMIAIIGAKTVMQVYARDPIQASAIWLAVDTVREGLGGGNEIVGGLWVLLVSFTALKAKALPRILNYLGILVSLAGIVTVVPALGEIGGAVFGLGTIVWFSWIGIALLRTRD